MAVWLVQSHWSEDKRVILKLHIAPAILVWTYQSHDVLGIDHCDTVAPMDCIMLRHSSAKSLCEGC